MDVTPGRDGGLDKVRLNGIDRRLEGVHLAARKRPRRWDEPARRIVFTTG